MGKPINVAFRHGLGDCVNFALQIPLYRKRGYDFQIFSRGETRILFEAAGASILDRPSDTREIKWRHSPGFLGKNITEPNGARIPQINKPAYNISQKPLPDIGPPNDLWGEYINTEIPIRKVVKESQWDFVKEQLALIPRPITLIHSTGFSYRRLKSIPATILKSLFLDLRRLETGSLICLDKENLVSESLIDGVMLWRKAMPRGGLAELIALLSSADFLIGVDSGPFHLSGLTGTPALGIFPTPGHHPAKYCLPHKTHRILLPSTELPWFHEESKTYYSMYETSEVTSEEILKAFLKLKGEVETINLGETRRE